MIDINVKLFNPNIEAGKIYDKAVASIVLQVTDDDNGISLSKDFDTRDGYSLPTRRRLLLALMKMCKELIDYDESGTNTIKQIQNEI